MSIEITLPDAKPALEWVNGRAVQKVSPKRKHALAQTRFAASLDAWAHEGARGMVGTEWRFRIQPPGEGRRPLVPDIAFLSYRRLPYDLQQVTDEPEVAPDAVVEVLSPGDRDSDVEEKRRVYLAAGTGVIFLVDPESQTVRICDAQGEHTLFSNDVLEHTTLPGFRLPVFALFSMVQPRKPEG